MAAKRTTFQAKWSDDFLWVQSVKGNPHQAFCKLCKKNFELSNMGRRALTSHASSKNHKENSDAVRSTPAIRDFFQRSTSAGREPQIVQAPIMTLENESVLKAEVTWAMHVVMQHFSYNSCVNLNEIFKTMFPDSEIADHFRFGRDKASYVICHGIAPYFQSLLTKTLVECDHFVISFDESMNKVAQREQMDLVVRYWDNSSSAVASRYLDSLFLGHTTAEDLLVNFTEGLERNQLQLSKLSQISMDGPNVNFKFHRLLKERMNLKDYPELLDIGSCGLHVLHGAFKTGHASTAWGLVSKLRYLFYLFKDSPARRADYLAINGKSAKFPMKFCAVRWLENADVAFRAKDIWKNVAKYIQKTTRPPQSASFSQAKEAIEDKLFEAKLSFFGSIATCLEPFLRKFQCQKPMLPFLRPNIERVLLVLLNKFVKQEVLGAFRHKLENISLNDGTMLTPQRVDVGPSTRKAMAEINGLSELRRLNFLAQCWDFLINIVKKICERSPLKYPLTKSATALDPNFIVDNSTTARRRFQALVQILHDGNHVSALGVERAQVEFDVMLDKVREDWKRFFTTFDEDKDRVDLFFSKLFKSKKEFSNLFEVVKLVMILSHGNAEVERGFSINAEILDHNLKEASIIAQRRAYDGIQASGGVRGVDLKRPLLQSVLAARSRYRASLAQKNDEDTEEKKRRKVEQMRTDSIKVLQERKRKLLEEAEKNSKEIDEEIKQMRR